MLILINIGAERTSTDMTKKKKSAILGGILALSLVAATGVTSGFAWFATNSNVGATSLDVSCKSNARYLLIGKEDNAIDKSKSSTSVTFEEPEDNRVYPCSMWNSTDPLVYNGTTINFREFYTATVSDPSDAKSSYTSVTKITFGDPNYFIHYRCYLTLATGSPAIPKSSFVYTAQYAPNTDDAISCAIAVSWLPDEFVNRINVDSDHRPGSTTLGYENSLGQFELTDTTSQYIDLYFYIDGNTAHIYNEYTTPLVGSIGFKFKTFYGVAR